MDGEPEWTVGDVAARCRLWLDWLDAGDPWEAVTLDARLVVSRDSAVRRNAPGLDRALRELVECEDPTRGRSLVVEVQRVAGLAALS